MERIAVVLGGDTTERMGDGLEVNGPRRLEESDVEPAFLGHHLRHLGETAGDVVEIQVGEHRYADTKIESAPEPGHLETIIRQRARAAVACADQLQLLA